MAKKIGMPRNLYLVRHGESVGNEASRKYLATKDESHFSELILSLHESQYELTELGIEQAKQAGKWLKDNNLTKFDRYMVSNIVRAEQTASLLGLDDPEWEEDFNLRERDSGLFGVIKPSRRSKVYRDQIMFMDKQPFLYRPPQGESFADVCQRLKFVLDTMARKFGEKDVIIVCHGDVIRTFRIIIEHMPLVKCNDYLSTKEGWGKVPNCSITHFTRQDPSEDKDYPLEDSFNWVRMVCPAGGGENVDQNFSEIIRRKYSNEELLDLAKKNRG